MLISIISAFILHIVCQEINAQTGNVLPESAGETLSLVTDRSIYLAGDKIAFSSVYNNTLVPENYTWSTIAYVELINYKGEKISNSKYFIKDNLVGGTLNIPAYIPSGYYYLRIYTKWMRNYSPYLYTYKPVKIFSYSTSEVIGNENDEVDSVSSHLAYSMEDRKFQVRLTKMDDSGSRDALIERIETEDINHLCALSVSLKGSNSKGWAQTSFEEYDSVYKDEFVFLPEMSGLTISGKLVSSKESIPLQNSSIYLTSAFNSAFFGMHYSDSMGNFLFTLPDIHSNKYAITASDEGSEDASFLIHSEYCNREISLPCIHFHLEAEEEEIVKRLAINQQINSMFFGDSAITENNKEDLPFFGKPDDVVYQKDYIELDNLQEFFYEVVPSVLVKNQRNHTYLQLLSVTSLVNYPTLILLDNIPVANDEEFLSIPFNKIHKVEIIKQGYVIGDAYFNGIICVYSKNSDLAGRELNENSHFFDFEMVNGSEIFSIDTSAISLQDRLPVRKNTLSWNPTLDFSENTVQQINLKDVSNISDYELVIQDLQSGEVYIYPF